jgi:hypothetical protein
MTNHPSRGKIRYLRYCPRGFANEVTFFRVRPSEVAEVMNFIETVNARPDGTAEWWTAFIPDAADVAVDWADRGWE